MRIINLILLVATLSSCTFTPPYEKPCIEMPQNWRVESDETSTACNVRWWEQFQDPILTELIEEALESNLDLRIATSRIAQFRSQLGIVSSELYPQISAQGIASRQRNSQTLAGELSVDAPANGYGYNNYGKNAAILPDFKHLFPLFNNNYTAIFNASYEIDLWGRIRNASNAALAELLGQIDARRAIILSVVSSVASAYIQLRQYDLQLQISIQTVDSRKQSLHLAEIRFKEGMSSDLEVKQAASDLDEAIIQVIRYQTLIPQQENLISVLIGHPPSFIERGRLVGHWPIPVDVPVGLPADLIEQRPDILQIEEELIAANFRIGEARARFFPDITLTGYYGYESSRLSDLFTNPSKTWQWMVNLLQPIFTGWRLTSELNLAQSRKEELFNTYIQTVLNALKEVNDALIAYKNSKEAVAVQKEQVKNLGDYLHLATLQYENGLVDYLNVLDAERRLFAAQLNLAQGQADIFLSLVNIYKALGGGWVIDAENLMIEEWENAPVCK